MSNDALRDAFNELRAGYRRTRRYLHLWGVYVHGPTFHQIHEDPEGYRQTHPTVTSRCIVDSFKPDVGATPLQTLSIWLPHVEKELCGLEPYGPLDRKSDHPSWEREILAFAKDRGSVDAFLNDLAQRTFALCEKILESRPDVMHRPEWDLANQVLKRWAEENPSSTGLRGAGWVVLAFATTLNAPIDLVTYKQNPQFYALVLTNPDVELTVDAIERVAFRRPLDHGYTKPVHLCDVCVDAVDILSSIFGEWTEPMPLKHIARKLQCHPRMRSVLPQVKRFDSQLRSLSRESFQLRLDTMNSADRKLISRQTAT